MSCVREGWGSAMRAARNLFWGTSGINGAMQVVWFFEFATIFAEKFRGRDSLSVC